MTSIEILYFLGCPGSEPTIELVRRIAAAECPDATLAEVLVEPAEAERHRFLGSPSVRVDGIDVDPAARERTDFHYGCRMYDTGSGPSGVLPEAWIRAAVRASCAMSGS